MAELTDKILSTLASTDHVLSNEAFPDVTFANMKSALDRLGSREMVNYKAIDREETLLTPEAEGIASEGSHEAKVFEAVTKAVGGLKIADLPVLPPHHCSCPVKDLLLIVPLAVGHCRQGKCQGWSGQSF
jgi:hypothetical protein